MMSFIGRGLIILKTNGPGRKSNTACVLKSTVNCGLFSVVKNQSINCSRRSEGVSSDDHF